MTVQIVALLHIDMTYDVVLAFSRLRVGAQSDPHE
jgi:hypothetical protein